MANGDRAKVEQTESDRPRCTLAYPTSSVQSESKDLLLFYMIKDTQTVFLCSSVDSMPIGSVDDNHPVIFEVEMILSGEGYFATKWRYRVRVLWDDFQITRVE